MKQIPLTQGMVALVDDADYEFLSAWKWYALKHGRTFYVVRARHKADRPGPTLIYMHRVLFCPPPGTETDHISGNGLDNRQENLRAVTHAINNANRVHRNRNRIHDLPLGVHHSGRKFRAQIGVDGHIRCLGTFATPEEAHAAYMAARTTRIDNELRVM